MFLLGNVLIGQVFVASAILVAMGVRTLTEGGAGAPELAAAIGADLVMVGTIVVWSRRRHPGWRSALGLTRAGGAGREAGLGILLGPFVYGAVVLVSLMLAAAVRATTGRGITTPDQISPHLSSGGKVVAVVLAVLVAPVAEELFFRGMLYRAIRDRRGVAIGLGISSVLFGLVHYQAAPWQESLLLQVTMVFTGLILGAIYEWRGSLVANIVTHMTFNTIGVLLIFAIG
jgi:membrane protease YdiL (CAAX protease family)